ncbi:MAG: Methyltransferase type 11 [Anaerocolumna sp.]|nr:Methyltransferase type 11 [Anaerocolumna sp.]
MLDSIDYYNKYANLYFESTVDIDMGETLDKFTTHLPEAGEILDLGCGSGRDSLILIEHGFDVTAVDGSKELSELASIHIGQDVLTMEFDQLDFHEVFDGIWACASLLHIPSEELENIFKKVILGLKSGGVLYMSFKHGDFSGFRNGRYFNDFKTKTMKDFLSRFEELEILDIWKSEDTKSESGDGLWLNVLVKKTNLEQE